MVVNYSICDSVESYRSRLNLRKKQKYNNLVPNSKRRELELNVTEHNPLQSVKVRDGRRGAEPMHL